MCAPFMTRCWSPQQRHAHAAVGMILRHEQYWLVVPRLPPPARSPDHDRDALELHLLVVERRVSRDFLLKRGALLGIERGTRVVEDREHQVGGVDHPEADGV